ncbi:uncharacterized protein F5147DRAFT_574491, partial [Suillus discolor]
KLPDTGRCKNLTFHDWLMVFAYINTHPDLPQDRVVQHSKTHEGGPLEFTQATLSRKLKDCTHLEQHIESYPAALSSKQPCIVTHLDVKEALVEWIASMEQKGQSYTRAMLLEKRQKLEEKFGVLEAVWLINDGWIAPFCKAYTIKEYQCHGEAGSVDIEAVKHEWLWVGRILSTFPVRDRWNFDESSLFAMLTLRFATNADGSEKLPLFFIEHFGDRYVEEDWTGALKAVMDMEGDNIKAAEAVKKLASAACRQTGLVVKIQPLTKAPQLETLKHELMETVEELTT